MADTDISPGATSTSVNNDTAGPAPGSLPSSPTSPSTPEPTIEDQIENLTQKIAEKPADPAPYLRRSIAYQQRRPPNVRRAYSDACHAVRLANLPPFRDLGLVAEGQLRRAIALDYINRPGDAWGLLRTVQATDGIKSLLDARKLSHYFTYWCDLTRGKFEDAKAGSGQDRIEWNKDEVPLIPSATLKLEMFGDDPEGELVYPAFVEPPKQHEKGSHSPAVPAVREEWYQTDRAISISFFFKGIDKDAATVSINEDSICIAFPLGKDGAEYRFEKSYFAPVDSSKSSYRITPYKLEVTLIKAVPGLKWASFERTGNVVVPGPSSQSSASQPALSTSGPASQPSQAPPVNRAGPAKFGKDWDALLNSKSKSASKSAESSAEKQSGSVGLSSEPGSASAPSGAGATQSSASTSTSTSKTAPASSNPKSKIDTVVIDSLDDFDDEADAQLEANTSVDAFFKQLYAKADPDTQRAMMKSFVESNGTSLSTNWEEVKKAPVKTHPPEGTEVKKWT